MGVPTVEDVADFEGALNAFRRALEEEEEESNLADEIDGGSSALMGAGLSPKADLLLGKSQLSYEAAQEEWDVEASQEDWGDEEDVMELSGMDLDDEEAGSSGLGQSADGLLELRRTGKEEIGELKCEVATTDASQTESTELVEHVASLLDNCELPQAEDVGLEAEGPNFSLVELAEVDLTGRGVDVLEAGEEKGLRGHDEDRGQRVENSCTVGDNIEAAGVATTVHKEAEHAGVGDGSQGHDPDRDQGVEESRKVGGNGEAAGEASRMQKEAEDADVKKGSQVHAEDRHQAVEESCRAGGNGEAAGEGSTMQEVAEDAGVEKGWQVHDEGRDQSFEVVGNTDAVGYAVGDDSTMQDKAEDAEVLKGWQEHDEVGDRTVEKSCEAGGSSEAAGEASTLQEEGEDALVAVGREVNMQDISEEMLLQGQANKLADRDDSGTLFRNLEHAKVDLLDETQDAGAGVEETHKSLVDHSSGNLELLLVEHDLVGKTGTGTNHGGLQIATSRFSGPVEVVYGEQDSAPPSPSSSAMHRPESGKMTRVIEGDLTDNDRTGENQVQRVEKYYSSDLDVQAHEADPHQGRSELPSGCSDSEDGQTVTKISSGELGVDSEEQRGGSSRTLEGDGSLHSPGQAYGALNLLASVSQVVSIDANNSVGIADRVTAASETLVSPAHIQEGEHDTTSSTGAVHIVVSAASVAEVLSEEATGTRVSERDVENLGACVSVRTYVSADNSENSSGHYQHSEHASYRDEKPPTVGGNEGVEVVTNGEPSTADLETGMSVINPALSISSSADNKSEEAGLIGIAPCFEDTLHIVHEKNEYGDSFRLDTAHVHRKGENYRNVSHSLALQDMARLEGGQALLDCGAEGSDVIMQAASDKIPSMNVNDNEDQIECTSTETEVKEGFVADDHFMAEGDQGLQQDYARFDELAKAAVLRTVFGDIDETIVSTDGDDGQSSSTCEDNRVSAVDGPEENESALDVPHTYGTVSPESFEMVSKILISSEADTEAGLRPNAESLNGRSFITDTKTALDFATTSLSSGDAILDQPNDLPLGGSVYASERSLECTNELLLAVKASSPRHHDFQEYRNALLPVLGGRIVDGLSGRESQEEGACASAVCDVQALLHEGRDTDEDNLVATGWEGRDTNSCKVPPAEVEGSSAASELVSTGVPYYGQVSGDQTFVDLSLTVGHQDDRASKQLIFGQGVESAPALRRVNSRSMIEIELPGDDDFDTNLSLHVGLAGRYGRRLSPGVANETSKHMNSPALHKQAGASPEARDRDIINWERAVSSSQFFSQDAAENIDLTKVPAVEGAAGIDVSDVDASGHAENWKGSFNVNVLSVADTFVGNYDVEGEKSGSIDTKDATSRNRFLDIDLRAHGQMDEVSEGLSLEGTPVPSCTSHVDRDLPYNGKVIVGSSEGLESTSVPPCTPCMSSAIGDVLVVTEVESDRLGDYDLTKVTVGVGGEVAGRDLATFREPPNLNLSPCVEPHNSEATSPSSIIFHQEVEDIPEVDKVISMSGVLDEQRCQEANSGANSCMPVGPLGTPDDPTENGLVCPSAPDNRLVDILLALATSKASTPSEAHNSGATASSLISSSAENIQFDPQCEKTDNIELANVHSGDRAAGREIANSGNVLAGVERECVEVICARSYPLQSVTQELQAAPDAEGQQELQAAPDTEAQRELQATPEAEGQQSGDTESSIATATDGAANRDITMNGKVNTGIEGLSGESKAILASSSHVLSVTEGVQAIEAEPRENDDIDAEKVTEVDGAAGTEMPGDIEPTLGNTRVYSELRALMDLVKAQSSSPEEVKSLSECLTDIAASDAATSDSGSHSVSERQLECVKDVPCSGTEEYVDPVDNILEETGEKTTRDCGLTSFQSKTLVVDLCLPATEGEHDHDRAAGTVIQDQTMSTTLTNQQSNSVFGGEKLIGGPGSSADVPLLEVPGEIETPTITQGNVLQTVEQTAERPIIDLNTCDTSLGSKTRGRKRGTVVQTYRPRKRVAKEPQEVPAVNSTGGQQATRSRRRAAKDVQVTGLASSGTGSVEHQVPYGTWAPPVNRNWNTVEISDVQEKPKVRLKVLARKGTQVVQGQHTGPAFSPGGIASHLPAVAQPIALPAGTQPFHYPFYPHPPAVWPVRVMDPGIIASGQTPGPSQPQTGPLSAADRQLPVLESAMIPSVSQPGHSRAPAAYNLPPPPLGCPFAPRLEATNHWVLPPGLNNTIPQEVEKPSKRKPRRKAQAPPAAGLDAAASVADGNDPTGVDGTRKRQRRTPATGELNFSQLQQDIHRVRSIISRRLEAWGSHSNLLQAPDGGEQDAGDPHLIFDEGQREEFVQRMVTSCQANPRMRALFLGAVRRIADYTVMKTAASKSPCEAADGVVTAWEQMKLQQSANLDPFYKLCKAVDKLHNEGGISVDEQLASQDPEFTLLNRRVDGKWDLRIPQPVGKAPRKGAGNNAETPSPTAS